MTAICQHGKPFGVKCRLCEKAAERGETSPAGAVRTIPAPTRCSHLGADTGERIATPGAEGERLKLYECAVHGECVMKGGKALRDAGTPVACCGCGCKERALVPDGPRTSVLPGESLAMAHDGHHFNASILDYQGRRLLAYRAGRSRSQVHICALDGNMMPGRSVQLNLAHERATHGREDPRLFIHGGRLHVGFVGVTGAHGPTHCLYARLTDDLRVEQVIYPHWPGRAAWEKNWTWFEWGGELMALYSISPHVVLHVVNDMAAEFQRQTWSPVWSGGLLRGGASPVLIGDEYYHWFHGVIEKGQRGPNGIAPRRLYSVGLYTFTSKPPFQPLRYTPEPLLWGDPKTRPADLTHADVVFPCGAVLDGERWLVSAGVHDSSAAVYEWAVKDVERRLVKI